MARFHLPRARVWWSVLAVLVVALIGLRLALPSIVRNFVNDKLQQLNGYSGNVAEVDISLWRGAYTIRELTIEKTNGKVPVPFVSAETIELSVEWKALLDGAIVAELELFSPKVNFVNAKAPAKRQTTIDKSWTDTVKELVPIEINRVAIHDGQVHYRDLESDPRVDIFVQKLDATAHNLTNSQDLGGTLYATVSATALAMGSGRIKFDGEVDPYAPYPTFEVKFRLDGLEIKQLNPFLKAYANVDAEAGKFSLDAEFAAHDGRFKGYAKPFIKDLAVLRWNEEEEGFFGKLWEGVVEVVGELFTNHNKDQIATRVPFSGSVKDPSADIWSTVGGIIKNAFLQSLRRGIEGSLKVGKDSQLSKG